MSINKPILNLPDTKTNFSSENNALTYLSGIFVLKKGVVFPSIESFQDIDYFYSLLESGDLTPLHYIKEVEYLDEETILLESTQDFTTKLRPGKYRQKFKFTWQIERHQLVEQISGSDLPVIYIDRSRNIYGTSDDGVTVRGFTTNRLILDKLLFGTDSTPAFSVLDIELRDSDELNKRGVIKQVDWNPVDINRLFMSINIEYLDSDTLNFSASYNGVTIAKDKILQSDITISDNSNGNLNAGFYGYGDGVFQLKDFNLPLTSGIMEILSNLYMGCINYLVRVIAVPSFTNYDFEDAANFEFEDSLNFDFET